MGSYYRKAKDDNLLLGVASHALMLAQCLTCNTIRQVLYLI